MIVKYTLEVRTSSSNSEQGATAPECIKDGGYFYDSTDNTYIGYSDGAHPLSANCVEITEKELGERYPSKEISIKSNGIIYAAPKIRSFYSYTAVLPINAKVYLYDDPTCEFYSERPEGRKKYWGSNSPIAKNNQLDSDSQAFMGYSEISGVLQEWYYKFTNFDKMMTFVNSHKPINLNPTLEAKMRDNPASVRPSALINTECSYLASLEITAAGDKTTTIYFDGGLEDVPS